MSRPTKPEEMAYMMRQLVDNDDNELRHARADELLCRVLRELGYEDAVEVFNGMRRWCT